MQTFLDYVCFAFWAKERATVLAMEAEETPLAAIAIEDVPGKGPAWVVEAETIRRPDGNFFQIAGVNVTRAAGREVTGWRQPMIMGDGNGYIALVRRQFDGCLLLRLKAEPGNLGFGDPARNGANTRVLVAPPLQFSQSNLAHHERAMRGELDDKGGKINPVPLAHLVAHSDSIRWENASEDGGRFFEKWNRYGVFDLIAPGQVKWFEDAVSALGEGAKDFAWVDLSTLRTLRKNGLANGHLRSAMSLLV